MEYVQMTLDDWVQMKQKLKQELLGVKQSFVRIGYALRKIEEQRLYEQDGYKSIAEFAKEEYGLEPSTTSRFMRINREYSVDGYSEILRPEFADLGRSQLEEMLKLPDSDRQMIQPEASREDIRNLKRFNKTEPAAGVADDIRQLIEKFYKDNPEILNAVFSEQEFEEKNIKHFAEIVNPGGNRSYKKGMFFLMMYENRVAIKKFGDNPRDLSWWEFYKITMGIFGDAAAGDKTWQRYFGGEDEKETSTQREQPVDPEGAAENNDAETESVKYEKADEIPGQMEITRDMPEYCPDSVREEVENVQPKDIEPIAPAQKNIENTGMEEDSGIRKIESNEPEKITGDQVPESVYGSRKEYIDTLTEYGAAEYIARFMRRMRSVSFGDLTREAFWQAWLEAEVDENGNPVEIVR